VDDVDVHVDVYVDNVDEKFFEDFFLKKRQKIKKKIYLVWITGRKRDFFEFKRHGGLFGKPVNRL
jgi:hypothetical protein